MKKAIILFSLIMIVLGVDAQTAPPKYYAIDGSTWLTKYDRDKKENLLWEKVDIDLRAALVAGRLGNGEEAKAKHKTLQNLFQLCRESFATIRLADVGKEALQNPEFRFFLSQNGVKARTGIARNGEPFNMEEYAGCFDSVLREYSFNAEIVAELSKPNGEEYNLDFVVDDFSERMDLVLDEIEREKLAAEFKEGTIRILIPRYNAAKKEEMKSQQKQNRRNR